MNWGCIKAVQRRQVWSFGGHISMDFVGLPRDLHTNTLGFLLGHWSLFCNCLLAFLLTGMWTPWRQWFCLFPLLHSKAYGAWYLVGIHLCLWIYAYSEWVNKTILFRRKRITTGTVMGMSIRGSREQQTFYDSTFWSPKKVKMVPNFFGGLLMFTL